MLYEHIVKLQKDLELKEPLGTENSESFAIMLDDTRITIKESGAGFQLSAKLGSLPTEKVEDFLSHMLRGNLFGQATHNAVLGLDDTGSTALLQYHYPLKPAYKEFQNAVEDFVNTVLFWQEEIKSHPSPISS